MPPPSTAARAGGRLAWLLGLVFLMSAGGAVAHPRGSGTHGHTAYYAAEPARFFSPASVWNRPLGSRAALDPSSRAIVGNLRAQEQAQSVGLGSFGGPTVYIARAKQPEVRVTLTERSPELQTAFHAVPIPAAAQPALGTDATMAVYQPSTDTMWEFWHMSRQPTGWQAAWGGRMLEVSTNPGYYRDVVAASGNVLEQENWGAPATSFPLIAGTMTIAELQAGHIHHALALEIGHTLAGAWAAPAQRTDGDISAATNPSEVPEGAHFRLPAGLDLGALHLPHFIYMMAVAAQRYGVIIDNRSSGFTFRNEDATQYVRQFGYNPYMGRHNQPGSTGALYSQWPSAMLRLFPWSHLKLLRMSVRTEPNRTPFTP